MKQRVVIAMALLLKPELVIADEPTTALDVLVQAQVISLLKSLKADEGMSFILITHDLAVLSEIADVVGIMYGGQIVEFGSLQEVYENPRHPYTQGLLKSIPTMRGGPPSYIAGVPRPRSSRSQDSAGSSTGARTPWKSAPRPRQNSGPIQGTSCAGWRRRRRRRLPSPARPRHHPEKAADGRAGVGSKGSAAAMPTFIRTLRK